MLARYPYGVPASNRPGWRRVGLAIRPRDAGERQSAPGVGVALLDSRDMNVPLIAAGCLGVLAALVHGIGGEVIVVRKLGRSTLPTTAFGGPEMTKAMIHVSWHIATIAFLVAGVGMVLAGSILHGDTARAVGVSGAVVFSGAAILALGIGVAHTRAPANLLRHPGPAILTLTAVLAWWGGCAG